MAPRDATAERTNGGERVRERLLSALHLGRLRPGERVLSVRKLADMTGVNPKTVHRAYRELARDGILEVRPGSGTFVTERRTPSAETPPTPALLEALDRCRVDAERLGVEPAALSRFLTIALTDGVRGVRVGLIECNAEQIAMIGRDLHERVGLEVEPLPLARVERDPGAVARRVQRVVTTDCHYAQVNDMLGATGTRIYTVTMDPRFPRELLAVARRHGLVFVQRDVRFGRVMTNLLRQIGADDATLERIRFVDARWAAAVLRSAPPGTRAWFTPLVPPETVNACPAHVRRIGGCWHLETSAEASLRAALALELAREAEPR